MKASSPATVRMSWSVVPSTVMSALIGSPETLFTKWIIALCFSVACFVAGAGEACVSVGAGVLGSSLSRGGAKSAEPSLPLSGLATTGAGVSWTVLTASEADVGVSTLVASEDFVED